MATIEPHVPLGRRSSAVRGGDRSSSDVLARVAAVGGILGPVAFVGGWIAGLALTPGSSIVDDAISRLAAVGAEARPLMTAGFIGFGVALPVYGLAVRRVLAGPAWLTAVATGLATLGVAAFPLDHSAEFDRWHGTFATIGYVTIAATPLLAARPLRRHGCRVLSTLGVVTGAVASISLALTASSLPTGLFQRIGLTAADMWIVTSAAMIAAGRLEGRRCNRGS